MRIFYAAQTTPNEIDLPGSRLWHANLYLPLVDLGHDLIEFSHEWLPLGYAHETRNPEHQNLIREQRPIFSAKLLEEIKASHSKKHIDLFFSYFTSAHVEPAVVREIRALGIRTVNWYCNASYQFHNVAEIAPAYDYCLVPEKFRLPDYRKIGANPIYCQEAANPNVYRPYDVPVEFDLTFVGQKYGNRPEFLGYLVDHGLDLRVWGPNWTVKPSWLRQASRSAKKILGLKTSFDLPASRCGPPLSDLELIQMYSRSKISLGFTSVAEIPTDGSPPLKQVRLRDFEATMSGAFYMVEYFDELAEFFEPDKEVIMFKNKAELADKSRYYLAHDLERERIRQAGHVRAKNEHTWQNRFKTVFKQMGLS